MKKSRSSGKSSRSSKKSSFSRGSSSKRGSSTKTSFSGKSLFSRKSAKKQSRKNESYSKEPRSGGSKERFVKPHNDPGEKNRPFNGSSNYGSEDYDNNYTGENLGNGGTSSNSGGGCLGSVSGIIKFVIFMIALVLIITVLKCGC